MVDDAFKPQPRDVNGVLQLLIESLCLVGECFRFEHILDIRQKALQPVRRIPKSVCAGGDGLERLR